MLEPIKKRYSPSKDKGEAATRGLQSHLKSNSYPPETLEGHKQNLVCTRIQEKGAVTLKQTDPVFPMSVQESLAEAWVSNGLLQGKGHSVQQCTHGTSEGGPIIFITSTIVSSVQLSSVAQSCPTLCDPMNHSTPGLPVHHQLPEFTETHVHRVSDAIQPSHPLSSPSPPAPNPSQHQSLFQ